jgi:hypothetical protein
MGQLLASQAFLFPNFLAAASLYFCVCYYWLQAYTFVICYFYLILLPESDCYIHVKTTGLMKLYSDVDHASFFFRI